MKPLHPGEHLQLELVALSMSGYALAKKIGLPATDIQQLLEGKMSITPDTATRLAQFFGTSAQFWTNLQTLHDRRKDQDCNQQVEIGQQFMDEHHDTFKALSE